MKTPTQEAERMLNDFNGNKKHALQHVTILLLRHYQVGEKVSYYREVQRILDS